MKRPGIKLIEPTAPAEEEPSEPYGTQYLSDSKDFSTLNRSERICLTYHPASEAQRGKDGTIGRSSPDLWYLLYPSGTDAGYAK